MLNKKFNFFVIFLLSVTFLFTCFSIIEADELYTVTDAWKKEDVYRPNPVLFLHGFAAGSPETWEKVVGNLNVHHFAFYYRGEKYGHSFGKEITPYLESIQFFNEADHPEAGKNNSVDTYKAGDYYVDIGWRNPNDSGGADKVYYWLYELVPPGVNNRLSYLSEKNSTGIIPTYTIGSEKPKVNMICHSLGGVSARQFLKQYGAGDVAKLITVGTPHKGSPLATAAHGGDVGTELIAKAIASTFYLPRLSKILIPKIEGASLWPPKIKIGIRKSAFTSYVSGINNTRVNLLDLADIDIQGDAVRDLIPGCAFLTQLNSSIPGGLKYYCVYGQYSAIPYIHIGLNAIGGDMVVLVASQKADGVGIPWKEMKRIYTYHSNEGATLAKNDCKTLLGFLDDTEPVLDLVRVLESKDINLSTLPERPEEEGWDWDNEGTDWTQHKVGEDSQPFLLDLDKYGRAYIEGKVDKEYLPATTKVNIKVYKEGETTVVWDNSSEDHKLKPYAGMQPTPAGFRYEVLFAKDKDTAPEPGVYEIKVFVENPAELKSEEKTVKVRIGAGHYFHVQLSPSYVGTGSPVSQTQTFSITVQCYNYGEATETPAGTVNKLDGTQSWVKDDTGVWQKEEINPNQDIKSAETKSDCAGEVSFGLNTQGYELYAGGEKLETLWLVDGAGTISGVVIKAEDGNIGDNHLFLIISASDGTGNGNGALMVNPLTSSTIDVPRYARREISLGRKVIIDTQEVFDREWNCLEIGWYHDWRYLGKDTCLLHGESWTPGWPEKEWGDYEPDYWASAGFYGLLYRVYNNFVDLVARKFFVRFNLSGWTPEQVEKAWMRVVLLDWRANPVYVYAGSLKNITTGKVGTLKLDEDVPYVYFYDIPASDFGDCKEYNLGPSLDLSNPSLVKPQNIDWSEYHQEYRRGLETAHGYHVAQILFIPKTVE